MKLDEKALEAAWAVYHGSTNDQRGALSDAIRAYLEAATLPDVAGLTDAELSDRLRAIAIEVFPSANQYGVADSVRRLVSIFERLTPEDYASLHRSMYPPRTDRFDDGQPDEMQEWHDYDADC